MKYLDYYEFSDNIEVAKRVYSENKGDLDKITAEINEIKSKNDELKKHLQMMNNKELSQDESIEYRSISREVLSNSLKIEEKSEKRRKIENKINTAINEVKEKLEKQIENKNKKIQTNENNIKIAEKMIEDFLNNINDINEKKEEEMNNATKALLKDGISNQISELKKNRSELIKKSEQLLSEKKEIEGLYNCLNIETMDEFLENWEKTEVEGLQPGVQQPVVEQPVVEQPVVEQPEEEQPVVEQPEEEQPVVEQPVVEQPVVEQPVVEQPVVEQPVVEQPEEEQSVEEQPVVEQPEEVQPEGQQEGEQQGEDIKIKIGKEVTYSFKKDGKIVERKIGLEELKKILDPNRSKKIYEQIQEVCGIDSERIDKDQILRKIMRQFSENANPIVFEILYKIDKELGYTNPPINTSEYLSAIEYENPDYMPADVVYDENQYKKRSILDRIKSLPIFNKALNKKEIETIEDWSYNDEMSGMARIIRKHRKLPKQLKQPEQSEPKQHIDEQKKRREDSEFLKTLKDIPAMKIDDPEDQLTPEQLQENRKRKQQESSTAYIDRFGGKDSEGR